MKHTTYQYTSKFDYSNYIIKIDVQVKIQIENQNLYIWTSLSSSGIMWYSDDKIIRRHNSVLKLTGVSSKCLDFAYIY